MESVPRQKGSYRLLELNNRVDGQEMPEMELVDMRLGWKPATAAFSRSLQMRLKRVLEARNRPSCPKPPGYDFILCRQWAMLPFVPIVMYP